MKTNFLNSLFISILILIHVNSFAVDLPDDFNLEQFIGTLAPDENGKIRSEDREILIEVGYTDQDIEVLEYQMNGPPALNEKGVLSEYDVEMLRRQGYTDKEIQLYQRQLQGPPALDENNEFPPIDKELLMAQGYSEKEIEALKKKLIKEKEEKGGFKSVGTIPLDKKKRNTIDYEINPYSSFIGYGLSLTDPIVLENDSERGVYSELIKRFHLPKFFTFQVVGNPFPAIGAYIQHSHKGVYRKSEVSEGLNLIQAVTAGYPDPASLALLIGNRVYMWNKASGKVTGLGMGGILLNYGNYHIVSNKMIQDHWLESELKLKGADIQEMRNYSYSFRVGFKIHSNKDIKDVLFFAFKRDRTDKDYFGWSIFKNSDFETRLDVDRKSFAPTMFTAVVGKKFPSKSGKYVFSLSIGVLSIMGSGYNKEGLGEDVETGIFPIIRPNVSF